MISFVVAADRKFTIGYKNGLPWPKVSADMKHFRELTTGKTVVMGRKTYESIGKPLPNRNNIVLTRDPHFRPQGVTVLSSVDEVLAYPKDGEICIIGGATIYKEFLAFVDVIHFTLVDGEFEGDTFLQNNIFEGFTLVDEVVHEKEEKNPLKLYFRTYKRT